MVTSEPGDVTHGGRLSVCAQTQSEEVIYSTPGRRVREERGRRAGRASADHLQRLQWGLQEQEDMLLSGGSGGSAEAGLRRRRRSS